MDSAAAETYAEITKPKPTEDATLDSKLNSQENEPPKFSVPLSVKKSLEFLLSGSLKTVVCRFCLNITAPLSEMDRILNIALPPGELHSLSIRKMIAHVHPFKLSEDPNFPSRICDMCLDSTLTSYLFIVQCERSERALRNCLDEVYTKLMKLDPLEPTRKRGRHKEHPNHNVIITEHKNVIDYAKPVTSIVNSTVCSNNKDANPLECPRCWQEFPSKEQLIIHERSHPKSMWFNCKKCGKSFPKHLSYRKHLRQCQNKHKNNTDDVFKCLVCYERNENYMNHLQHVEKHKFKMVFEHLINQKLDELCVVCFEKNKKMVDMGNEVFLHGGCPELMGKRNVYKILEVSVPEMTIHQNYTGTKVCVTCLDHAITSFIFINRTQYIRSRLHSCITNMLVGLEKIPSSNVFIEIPDNSILPITNTEDLTVEILEDEFRIESSDENDEDVKPVVNKFIVPAKDQPITTLVNGFHKTKNVCDEFLMFKKKTKSKPNFICPICNKRFLNKYFLKKHVKKHTMKSVSCDECNITFKSMFSFNEHVKRSHILQQRNFKTCNICDRTFSNVNRIKAHKRIHRIVQCDLCNKHFKSQRFYLSHFHRHAMKFLIARSKSNYTCSFCEKVCLNNNELSYHVNKSHLQIKSFPCHMCDKEFYTQSELCCHRQVHSQYCKEKCEICNKVLKSRSKLVMHIQKHLGHKPYTCMLCNEAFYSENNLKKHVRSLHGGMFNCNLCKSVFSDQYSLKSHSYTAHSIF